MTFEGYRVTWCFNCDTACIVCKEKGCYGSFCNCGGCPVCLPVFERFKDVAKKIRRCDLPIEDQMHEEEEKFNNLFKASE